MKRISEYKRPKSTTSYEAKRESKRPSKLKLPYDLTSVLSKHSPKFLNLGSKAIRFDFSKKNVSKVDRRSLERSLYTNDRNPLSLEISRFSSLEDLELSSHDEVEVSLLRHEKLRSLSLVNIGKIRCKKRPWMRSLKRLAIIDSMITFKAFKAFNRLENLAELKVIGTAFKEKVNSRKILSAFKRSRKLKSLTIECCDWKEEIYYEIVRVLDLNKFHFVVPKKYVSFDMTITSTSRMAFSNFDPRFYSYKCEGLRSIICADGLVDVLRLQNLEVSDLREFSTRNTKIDRSFVESFLFRFDKIAKLSFPGCHIDSILLYSILRKYRKTLRHFDVSCMVVPFDFLSTCRNLLYHCRIIFGQESNILEVD